MKSGYISAKRKVPSALATTLEQKVQSAVVAEGPVLQLPASSSESLIMPVPAPVVSAGVAEEAEEVMVAGLQNSQRDNMVAAQSARCSKRRKLNVVDVDLSDERIDSFLPQIVAILKTCWLWLP